MKIDKLKVLYKGREVGTLALTVNRRVAFAYDDDWLKHGFSISPFSLPLKKQVFVPEKDYFYGLFGVFADSLPDAWGNLLLTRLMKEKGIRMDQITMLDRLAIVGDTGMGALTYKPEMKLEDRQELKNLDYLCEECHKILNTEYLSNRSLSQVISADYFRWKHRPQSAVNDADAHYTGGNRRLSRAYFSTAEAGLK